MPTPVAAPVAAPKPIEQIRESALPKDLLEEFNKPPTPYSEIRALNNQSNIAKSLQKWQELGPIKFEDLSKANLNMRIGVNDTKSGYGQVDDRGKL